MTVNILGLGRRRGDMIMRMEMREGKKVASRVNGMHVLTLNICVTYTCNIVLLQLWGIVLRISAYTAVN